MTNPHAIRVEPLGTQEVPRGQRRRITAAVSLGHALRCDRSMLLYQDFECATVVRRRGPFRERYVSPEILSLQASDILCSSMPWG